jgi:hypothetical protein
MVPHSFKSNLTYVLILLTGFGVINGLLFFLGPYFTHPPKPLDFALFALIFAAAFWFCVWALARVSKPPKFPRFS